MWREGRERGNVGRKTRREIGAKENWQDDLWQAGGYLGRGLNYDIIRRVRRCVWTMIPQQVYDLLDILSIFGNAAFR